jgi:replicative DNA helicase
MVKTLPVNSDIERLVLGCILLDENLMHNVRPVVAPEDFAEDRNQRIWRQACGLYDAGKHVDYVTVYEALEKSEKSGGQSIGGLSYIASLTDGMPMLPDLTAYVRILRDYSTRRKIMHVGQTISQRAASGEDVQPILDSMGRYASDLASTETQRGLISAGELVDDIGMAQILAPRSKRGMLSPWGWMNKNTFGILPGELWVLAGHTSTGKTSAALQWAVHVARKGAGAAFFTLEMHPVSLYQRAVWQMAGIDSERAKANNLHADERDRVRDCANVLYGLPIYFDDTASTVMAIHAAVRRRKLQNPIGLIVVDYLQLLGAGGRHNTRAEEVGSNARALKLMASEFQCPVILLSQFSRESNKPGKQRRPELSDLKESGDIENHANGIWFIYREDMTDADQVRVQFMLPKQRDGRRNIYHDFWFMPKSQSFADIED